MTDPRDTLKQALSIIAAEVDKISTLSTHSRNDEGDSVYHLDKSTATVLTDYVKVLLAVSKAEQEVAKSEGLHKKSESEIDELLAEATKHLNKEAGSERKMSSKAKKPKK